MRNAVKSYFIKFTEPFEGVVYNMYQDVKGLVSTGLGELIDPAFLGMPYPWRRPDGSLASAPEYSSEWNLIKSRHELAHDGWVAAKRFCTLHLTLEDITTLVFQKLENNEAVIRSHVPDFDNLCADAQLFLHSWAWAVGPNARYPRMLALINAKSFYSASNECDINPKVGTIILRNAANRQLLLNAACVQDQELDPEVLVYPSTTGKMTQDHTVVTLQHALSLLGFPVSQDSILGPKTTDAIKRFQASHKLLPDGVAGPLTWAAIQQALRLL